MPVLFAFNLQTKCEMSSMIRSRGMAWAPKCRNKSRDPDHAHLGDSQHDKANASPGQLVYKIWSLQLQPLQRYFKGCKKSKVSRDPNHAHLGDNSQENPNTSRGQLVYQIWSL